MITKNIRYYLAAGLLCCGLAAVLTACSEDDVDNSYSVITGLADTAERPRPLA